MDALGQYVSFQAVGAQWGIYIPVTGIAYLIKNALSQLRATPDTKRRLAFHAILNHELFHFATDCAIAQAELIHQEPWYVPAKAAFKRQKPDYCVIEEQLANAYMLKAFRTMKLALRIRGKQDALREFTKSSRRVTAMAGVYERRTGIHLSRRSQRSMVGDQQRVPRTRYCGKEVWDSTGPDSFPGDLESTGAIARSTT
ncbi:MAG TPA: hypothetical protein VKE71_15555 [Candidatus Angelobacter sp.]|nr:hypothetical protein [Candidatus Angelobacter sp.]